MAFSDPFGKVDVAFIEVHDFETFLHLGSILAEAAPEEGLKEHRIEKYALTIILECSRFDPPLSLNLDGSRLDNMDNCVVITKPSDKDWFEEGTRTSSQIVGSMFKGTQFQIVEKEDLQAALFKMRGLNYLAELTQL